MTYIVAKKGQHHEHTNLEGATTEALRLTRTLGDEFYVAQLVRVTHKPQPQWEDLVPNLDCDLPRRHGAPWTSVEECDVIIAYRSGSSIKEIARRQNRTENSIRIRLRDNGFNV